MSTIKPSPGSLKNVIIPGDLSSTFLQLAKVNSDQCKETLGILGGVEEDQIRVTHLTIPRQTGYSDRCVMDNDVVDVWEAHTEENVIFLGTIHTHPEYSVFLSSVDMHQQFEYQRMLPEVINFYFDKLYSSSSFKGYFNGMQHQGWCDWSPEAH